MNARRARSRRRLTGPLDPDSRRRIEEVKNERRQALIALQTEMQPAYDTLLDRRAEIEQAISTHKAASRAKRSGIRQDFAGRLDAIRQAAAANIHVTAKVPA